MPSRSASPRDAPEAETGYWFLAQRPLHILAFLLPLIIGYEICLALVLSRSGLSVNTVLAHEALFRFFGAFGLGAGGGLYLGGVLIALVLLAWHLLTGDDWRLTPRVLLGMAAEVFVLTLPLVLVGQLIAGAPTPAAAAAPGVMADRSVWLALSLGAGLYEELLFRMVLIAVVHTLLVDVGKIPDRTGTVVAILVSSIAFAGYHLVGTDLSVFSRPILFYVIAGLYFGTIFTVRGFGIVVGVHALYDLLVVLMASPQG